VWIRAEQSPKETLGNHYTQNWENVRRTEARRMGWSRQEMFPKGNFGEIIY